MRNDDHSMQAGSHLGVGDGRSKQKTSEILAIFNFLP